jgi:hypothetical protein
MRMLGGRPPKWGLHSHAIPIPRNAIVLTLTSGSQDPKPHQEALRSLARNSH